MATAPGTTPLATTSTGTLGALIRTWYDKTALQTLDRSYYPFIKLAPQVRPIPAGEGKTAQFFRYKKMTRATTAITEGITPTSTSLSTQAVTVSVIQLGNWLPLTDLLKATAITNTSRDAAKLCGMNMWDSVDWYIHTCLFTGLSASASLAVITTKGFPVIDGIETEVWAGSVKLSGVGVSTIGPNYIRNAVAHLSRLDAPPFGNGNYRAICHSDTIHLIRHHVDLKDYMIYAAHAKPFIENAGAAKAGYKFTIEGVDFYQTTAIRTFSCGNTSTVWPIVIFGEGAYGRTEIKNSKDAKFMEILIKNPGPGDTSNPLNLFSTVGWKANVGATTLNPSCGVILVYKRKASDSKV
jgi:N4-gp56 family major capsid protein